MRAFAGLLLALIAGLASAQAVTPAAVNGTQYLSSPPTLSNFQKWPFLSDVNGNLKINCISGCSGGGGGSNVTIVAPLGSMLSASSVSVVPASDWLLPAYASTPTFNLGTLNGAATSALQTTGNGILSTINTTLGTPFQAGGSIGNTAFGVSGTLPAFAATPTFKIDQTTPGTTNAVSVTNFPATQPVSGTVAVSNFPTTQPVSGTVAVTQSTSPWVVGQSTASALNATVVGTGTFATQSTVTQATASSLNATVVGTGTFATQSTVSQATASNLNGTMIITDGTNTATVKAASTSPALTDKALVVAQSPNPAPVCTGVISINQTTSTDVHTFTNIGYICSVILVSATAQSISVIEGTGTVCASSGTALVGGASASLATAANGGFSAIAGTPWLKMQASADHLCVLQGSSGNVSGIITYLDHA